MKISTTLRNQELQALTLANSGIVRIYNGTIPADPQTAVSGQTLLSEHTLSATAFQLSPPVAPGISIANPISDDTDANATGNASWFRVLKSDGTTVLWDGTVGTSGADLILNSIAIQIHAQVSIASLTYTIPE